MIYYIKTQVLLRRFLAFWLDIVVITVAGSMMGLWQWTTTEGILGIVTAPLCYRTICDAYAGRTLGKLIFRIRTVRNDAFDLDGVGLWRSVGRNLLVIVDHMAISSIIGILIPFMSDGNRRIGDMAASTMVVGEGSLKEARRSIQAPTLPEQEPRQPGDEGEPRRRRAGKDGELMVAAVLEKLCHEEHYYLFNHLPEQSVGDIDHLLIGPCGLLIVETKANRGVVSIVEGTALIDDKQFPTDPIQQATVQWEVMLRRLPKLCTALPSWSRFHKGANTAGLSWLACFPNALCVLQADDPVDAALASRMSTPTSLPNKVLGLQEVLHEQEIDGLAEGVSTFYGVQPHAVPYHRTQERP